jgi:hypothetical protein
LDKLDHKNIDVDVDYFNNIIRFYYQLKFILIVAVSPNSGIDPLTIVPELTYSKTKLAL